MNTNTTKSVESEVVESIDQNGYITKSNLKTENTNDDMINKFIQVKVKGMLVEAFRVTSTDARNAKVQELLAKYSDEPTLRIVHANVPPQYIITGGCPNGICPVKISGQVAPVAAEGGIEAVEVPETETKVKKATKVVSKKA